MSSVTNVVFVGIGGQGVITASDILAAAAFEDGFDVKKSEIHGMAQRGGAVTSDVRYGATVFSPMIPTGEADYVIVLDVTQVDYASRFKKPKGLMLTPLALGDDLFKGQRGTNIALLGVLAPHLTLSMRAWEGALLSHLKPELHAENLQLFRTVAERTRILS
ncbi:MAG: 2-oxoacid:acceptor oxidoreductase family protein [Polyangiaceae bacterium]